MGAYHIACTPISIIDSVKSKWLMLSASTETNNVFLDWFWIGNWLRQIHHLNPRLIEIKYGCEIVGLGIYCERLKRVCGFTIRECYLHRCGIEKYDQTWIEFNHFLCAPQHQTHCIAAFVSWIQTQGIDEWRIALVDDRDAWANNVTDRIAFESTPTPAYLANLNSDISSFESYVATLSSNSRSTVRRAKKYIEQAYGDINYSVVQNQLDDHAMTELMSLHKLRWHKGSEKSGFHNPIFIDFHQYLQSNPSESFHIETLIFKAGQLTLGYLYNLVGKGNVKFYLSAINYSDPNNRFQPGLVMHALAITHYASEGYDQYDFMGGDNRYKRSLSNQPYHLHEIILRPNTMRNHFFQFLRRVKNRIFNVGRRVGLQ